MPEVQFPHPCPLCEGPMPAAFDQRPHTRHRLNCHNCGDHVLTDWALDDLPGIIRNDLARARVAYGVRKLPTGTPIDTGVIDSLLKSVKLPPAMERIDNLVMYLATEFAPGRRTELDTTRLRAVLGTTVETEAQWVVEQALQLNYLTGREPQQYMSGRAWVMGDATLTINGWRRHAELMRDGAGSRHAFMAMDFNEPDIAQFIDGHLRDAVGQTGFELRTTDHPAKTAGLIDNRMRVEIRTSRFVVCDLTHGNRGAYWEAGFAEGIGRPVFYICRHDVRGSADPATRPHFDTAHQTIIAWDPDNPTVAAEELKAMIRATLPAEARMQDA